jgi:hypothetical protein
MDVIKKMICKSELDKIQVCEQMIAEKNTQIDELNAQILKINDLVASDKRQLQLQIENYTKQIEQLNNDKKQLQANMELIQAQLTDQSVTPIPPDVQVLIDKYNNKYAPADITYSGRYFDGTPNMTYEQDLKNFALCGQNDFQLHQLVKNNSAFVKDIQIANPTWSFHRCCDEAVLRIAKAITVNYVTDDRTSGVPEYWMYAVERYHLGKGDCEDHAHLRHVCYRIAGVPAGLLRINCGSTKGNLGGHSTNYYLKSDGKFYHINSTSNIFNYNDWKLNDDPNDEIGLSGIWFSFNDENAWSQFTTDASRTSFYSEKAKDTRRLRFVTIKPKKWIR